MSVNPNTTRGMAVLQIAAGLSCGGARELQPVLIQSGGPDGLRMSSNSNSASLRDVIEKRVDLGLANPSAALVQAYRGFGAFDSPQPVRLIAVLPSRDQFVFMVSSQLKLAAFEEIAAQTKIRLSLRGDRGHCLHDILAVVARAAGFALADIEKRGGEIIYAGGVPRRGTERFEALVKGETNALFEEGADEWLAAALARGFTALPLREDTIGRLEALGYRRAWLDRTRFPALGGDVLTIDFSGWAVFVHADLPGPRVRGICQALDHRAACIPIDGGGSADVRTMCRDTPEGPHMIPLHPAAEDYWRERGYI